jgi:spore cortex protein
MIHNELNQKEEICMKHANKLMMFLLTMPIFVGCGVNTDNDRNTANRFGAENVRYDNVNNNQAGYDDLPDNRRLNLRNVNMNNNENRMEVADEAADKVANLEEVRTANCIVTDQNAYVAVILDNNPKGEVTRDIENKIARAVKSTDPDIQNVYVSTNPDFVDRITDYGDKIQQGRPVQGLFEEFNEMVRRVFPTAR